MKILLDCVVTATDPNKCSSNIQFLTFVRRTLAQRDDVFFYWLIPDWISDELFEATYPQDDRVKYIRIPQHRDRTKEYFTLRKELDQAVAFNGDCWDFDVLLTMRTGMVPAFRLIMNSPRTPKLAWLKEVWLIEEMPFMDFKATVLTINADVQDMFTISGYLAADRNYILSYHEKPHIVRRARDFFTPSNVRKLADSIQPVITSQSDGFRIKDPSEYPDGSRPFCIAHSGRMEKANRIDAINDLMTKHFVMKGDKVRLLVTTVSAAIKAFDTSVVDVRQVGREEFWKLAKSEMDVFVHMSREGGFLLSLIEPMMLGVPAVVLREDWADGLLGKDYPFMAENEAQAYALVGMFYEDYAGMYAKWAAWNKEVFQPLMKHRFENDLLYKHLARDMETFAAKRATFTKTNPGKEENALTLDILEEVGDADEFVFAEVIERLVEAGKCDRVMLEKLQPGDRDVRGLAFCTAWNDYRVALQEFHGWEDASTTVGHMRRKKKV